MLYIYSICQKHKVNCKSKENKEKFLDLPFLDLDFLKNNNNPPPTHKINTFQPPLPNANILYSKN